MRRDAEAIIEESIRAVLPDAAVARALAKLDTEGPVYVVAIGKAAWRMAKAARAALGGRVRGAVVVTKYGHAQGPIEAMEIIEAGHPVPDMGGVRGAQAALVNTGPTGTNVNDLTVLLCRAPMV